MREYKKGDKVKMLNMPSGVDGNFPKNMVGKVVTVDYVDGQGMFTINKNKWRCNVSPKDVELVQSMCELCNGFGAIITFNDKEKRNEIQKCDDCNKYGSDIEAYKDLNPEVK